MNDESQRMVPNPPQEIEPKPAMTQIQAAKILGVTREHLNRVLKGHRESRRLTRLYNALISEQPKDTALQSTNP